MNGIDYTGQIFNNRVVLDKQEKLWRVKCLKCGSETILSSTRMKRHGCNCSWKNTVDEKYFDVIDTADKAYFFGFLFADGYVSSRFKLCKVDLQESDVDFLEKFKNAINFSGKINEYVAKKGESYRPEDAIVKRVSVINEPLAKNLEQKGLVAHRERSGFPFAFVPDEYVFDFIRGYFDGNGSISLYYNSEGGKIQIMIDICGGTNLLKDIGDILNKNGIEIRYHNRRESNPDNTQLFIYKKRDKIKFLDLIYGNATTYLNRKYSKYLKFMEALEL